jgi:hypothetical protein
MVFHILDAHPLQTVFLQTCGKVRCFVRSSSFRQLDKSIEDIRITVCPGVIMDAFVQQLLSETPNITCDLWIVSSISSEQSSEVAERSRLTRFQVWEMAAGHAGSGIRSSKFIFCLTPVEGVGNVEGKGVIQFQKTSRVAALLPSSSRHAHSRVCEECVCEDLLVKQECPKCFAVICCYYGVCVTWVIEHSG